MDRNSKPKKQKKAKKVKNKPSEIVEAMVDEWETASESDVSDVLGSYTGNPFEGEIPEQDADDL